MTFKREDKYLVLKWSDIQEAENRHLISPEDFQYLNYIIGTVQRVRSARQTNPTPKFVCVKDTWPEYETVWKMIEDRVTKKEKE